MYVRIFKSRDSSEAYTILYKPSMVAGESGKMFLDNEKHKTVEIDEGDLFAIIDEMFKRESNK